MNSKHRKTLKAIFSNPTPANLEWRRIESLFLALGAKIIEDDGSRADFHRPHPGKETKLYQVRGAKAFLERAGVKP